MSAPGPQASGVAGEAEPGTATGAETRRPARRDDDLVASHLDRLSEAGLDQGLFAQALAALALRATPKAVAIAVAEAYVGVAPGLWRSRPAALSAIRTRFEERRYQTAKLAAAKGVTPW